MKRKSSRQMDGKFRGRTVLLFFLIFIPSMILMLLIVTQVLLAFHTYSDGPVGSCLHQDRFPDPGIMRIYEYADCPIGSIRRFNTVVVRTVRQESLFGGKYYSSLPFDVTGDREGSVVSDLAAHTYRVYQDFGHQTPTLITVTWNPDTDKYTIQASGITSLQDKAKGAIPCLAENGTVSCTVSGNTSFTVCVGTDTGMTCTGVKNIWIPFGTDALTWVSWYQN